MTIKKRPNELVSELIQALKNDENLEEANKIVDFVTRAKRNKRKSKYLDAVGTGEDFVLVTSILRLISPKPPKLSHVKVPDGIEWKEISDVLSNDPTFLPHFKPSTTANANEEATTKKQLIREYVQSVLTEAKKMWESSYPEEDFEIIAQLLHILPTILNYPTTDEYRWIFISLPRIFSEKRYYAFNWLSNACQRVIIELPSINDAVITVEYEKRIASGEKKKG